MEVSPQRGVGSSSPLSEDFTGKLKEAQSQLEQLQHQQAEIERQKIELQELNENKGEFLQRQNDIYERLNTAITVMDREVLAARQELEELEMTRVSFADHLEKIDQLNPDGWNNESLSHNLTRALSVIDLAEEEYEQALEHFSNGRNSVFGGGASKSKRKPASAGDSELLHHFRNGFAYNLPLVLLGIIAMIVYLLK